jgi:hypothetical protein
MSIAPVRCERSKRHSILTPLASTIRAHFGASPAMKAAKSCGEPRRMPSLRHAAADLGRDASRCYQEGLHDAPPTWRAAPNHFKAWQQFSCFTWNI